MQQAGEGSVGAEQQGTPFVWTATAESILAKVARGRVALETSAKTESTRYQDRQARVRALGLPAGAGLGQRPRSVQRSETRRSAL